MHNPTMLYIKDARGDLRTWQISWGPAVLWMEYGLENGEKITQEELIAEGKQSRNPHEQTLHRMQSRINKMKDKGYVEDREEALAGTTNSIGLLKPMLASPLKNVRSIDWRMAYAQPKFDGHRCLVTRQYGEIIAYSRNGKLIHSIDHILKDIDIEEGQTLDGELYAHRVPLQTLSSWIKKDQAESKQLEYIVYDIMENMPYHMRLGFLKELQQNWKNTSVRRSLTLNCDSEEEALDYMMKFRDQGYEGAIIRHGSTYYEDGKRSKSLIKFKQVHDDIFEIVDIVPSREGWAILVCSTNSSLTEGKEFSVSAPGTVANKYGIMENAHLYIGRNVRVEYANMTKEWIPFHPIATNFPDDV